MYQRNDGHQCIGAAGAFAYACEAGMLSNQEGTQHELIYDNMFIADSLRGVTLRFAHESADNTCILKNSYFSGFSRPNCDYCYGMGTSKISYCSRGYAIRMLAVTVTGEQFPLGKPPLVNDVICTMQVFDMKAFLNNVTFENYLHQNPSLPFCSSMSVFKRHPLASDGTGSHHLTDTHCINCQTESWAYFERPEVSWRGWFGGCG